MRLRTFLLARRRALLGAVMAGAVGLGATACQNDVAITDPNAPSTGNFWQSAADAQSGVTATYNALLRTGGYQRWQAFVYDMRSDIATARLSPWGALAAYSRFEFPEGYDFEINREVWDHAICSISRANQVIANVPGIAMDAQQRDRLVAEAKFLRGLGYFRLMTLYGPAAPLVTDVPDATLRPASTDSAAMWAQIERDFGEAAAALPRQTMTQAGGRATAGAAQGMLGKARLQQRKWQQAAEALAPIVAGTYGAYALAPNYATLFRQEGEQRRGEPLRGADGQRGPLRAGALREQHPEDVRRLRTGLLRQPPDAVVLPAVLHGAHSRRSRGSAPRRHDLLLSWRHHHDLREHVGQWRQRDPGNYTDTTRIYFKKYGEYYIGSNDQNWEGQINYKVLRFADVLLMQAEALNEQGQTGGAAPLVNRVRERVGLRPLAAGLSQTAMREEILRQRLLEFGLEGQRWLDLGRQNLFSNLAELRSHDPDFATFVAPRSILLPVTQRERNLNPNVRQNPGY
jgi:hypothetical protein